MIPMKAVFADRDGTVNVRRKDDSDDTRNYVLTWADFEWLPGAQEACAGLVKAGYALIFISNQSGIARGVAAYREVDYIFQKMCKLIEEEANVQFPVVRYSFCHHIPEDKCECRKPKPGFFWYHLVDLQLRASECWAIGDQLSDTQAAYNAGIRKLIRVPSLEKPVAPAYSYGESCRNFHRNGSDGLLIENITHAVDFVQEWDTKHA